MIKFKGTTYLIPSVELARILTINPCPIRFMHKNEMYVVTKLEPFGSARPCQPRGLNW
jgi:hypothetical protein